jgi:hypothetical protein
MFIKSGLKILLRLGELRLSSICVRQGSLCLDTHIREKASFVAVVSGLRQLLHQYFGSVRGDCWAGKRNEGHQDCGKSLHRSLKGSPVAELE